MTQMNDEKQTMEHEVTINHSKCGLKLPLLTPETNQKNVYEGLQQGHSCMAVDSQRGLLPAIAI